MSLQSGLHSVLKWILLSFIYVYHIWKAGYIVQMMFWKSDLKIHYVAFSKMSFSNVLKTSKT